MKKPSNCMSSSKANSFGQQMLDEPDQVEKPLRQKEGVLFIGDPTTRKGCGY